MLDAIGIGALNYDRLYKVKKIAGKDEEEHVLSQIGCPGGSAANTIFGLGKLGLRVGYLGAVGKDPEGEEILEDFRNVGVDISRINMEENERTGQVLGFIDEEGERALYVSPGANSSLALGDADMKFVNNTRLVHLTSFVDREQLEMQKRAVSSLRKEVLVSFSPGSLYSRVGMEELRPILEKSYVLFLNRRELEKLAGSSRPLQKLLEAGCCIVVLTLGRNGCMVATETDRIEVMASSVEVIDTTGAGDAFAAGFLYGILTEQSLRTCAELGNLLASFCIGSMGAREGLPDRERLESFLPPK